LDWQRTRESRRFAGSAMTPMMLIYLAHLFHFCDPGGINGRKCYN
jgi:hypothetical protein